jgi:hypothetical protein
VALWIGDTLGPVERACLRSVMRHGHNVALYCYRKPAAVPEGVELRDAGAILAESKVFAGRNGSVAAFSDWFRYELLKRALGTWLDLDVYLLRPLDAERPYLFGEEEPGLINNAILRLPPESPMIPLLLEPFETGAIPRGLSWRQRLPVQLARIVRGQVDLARLPWGSTGPLAFSALARQFDLSSQALSRDVFYPVPWRNAEWIRDPRVKLADVTTNRTVAIHLWNDCIKDFKNVAAPEGSFLNRLQDEGRA